MKSKSSVLGAVIMAAILAVPALGAAIAEKPMQVDVGSPMKAAQQVSYDLSKTADRLQAITRSGGHSWQTHASYLSAARDNVNRLGKMLGDLERLKPYGTETQQLAIEKMRPQLVATADALTNAIELLNDRHHNLYFTEYREAVQIVSAQVDSLHQALDAVSDYEAAKARLGSLELLPPEQKGS